MRARDLMSHPAVTVRADTPVKEAMTLLSSRGFTALPVVDEHGTLTGIVTEADLVRDRVPADPRAWIWDADTIMPSSPENQLVGDVMTADVIGTLLGTDAAEIASTMVRKHVRSLPVRDGDKVAGVITRGDLLRVLAKPDTAIAKDVRHRLANYGGDARWTVSVRDGAVSIIDEFNDRTDRHVALVLAQGVPGVQSVGVESRADASA